MFDINLMPAEPEINGVHLVRLIHIYLAYCAQHTTAATVEGYTRHLRRFVRWWEAVGPSHEWICSPSVLAEYDDYLGDTITGRGDPLSAQGHFDSLRRLRQALHWAYTTQRTPVDMGQWIDLPEKPTKQRHPLPLWALGKLLDGCNLVYEPQRSRAIIAFLAGTGCRRMECANLMADNIRMDADGSGQAYLAVAKTRPRWVVFDRATGRYLVEWLDLEGWPVGKPAFGLGNQGIYRTVSGVAEAVGLGHLIQGPHDLRRLFVTHWNTMQSGEGYAILLQRQVGHRSLDMTGLYDLRGVEQIRQAFVSPVLAVAAAPGA